MKPYILLKKSKKSEELILKKSLKILEKFGNKENLIDFDQFYRYLENKFPMLNIVFIIAVSNGLMFFLLI